uniref:F-box associated beta-propeller type 3 domain-containing protein n=1 Tax=Brassica oleracea var. oleracea TaxID=109376 RepID=A0A0D3BS91_BRAOL
MDGEERSGDTGEFLTLPKVLLKEKNLLAKSNQAREEVASMYLGYDPMGKQFKVLCMTTTHYGIRDNTHQVLTLGSGKRFWRPVQRKFQFVENRVISREICINGVLYFGAGTERSTTIVCFDVGSEKFSFINTNRDMMYSCYMGSLTLFNYKGRLAIHHKVDSYQKRLMFWVIEDAENHKWSKHIYELSPLEKDMISYSRFVGMTGTGELVWSLYREPANSVYLTFYNFESQTFTKVNVQGFEEFEEYEDDSIYIKTYVDYVENMKWLV